MSEDEILKYCKQELSLMLGTPISEIANDASFESLRLNSLHAMQLMDELEDQLSVSLSPVIFWEYPTLKLFCHHIAELKTGQ